MWFHFLRLYFAWGKFHGSKTGWALVQVCVIRPNRGLKDKMIPRIGCFYDWQWSSNTLTNNMPKLVTDLNVQWVKTFMCNAEQ